MTKKGRLGAVFGRRPAATEEKEVTVFGNRSPEQIEAALEAAREARAAKKELLDSVKAGRVTLAEILGPDYKDNVRAQRLPVETLIRALPGVGVKTADSVMADLGITKTRKVGGLGTNQRAKLLGRLGK